MNYLMKKLKRNFEKNDNRINPEELNYKVGNTSGMDVGQVPAEIAQRVGNLAQRGGSEMEILLNNPATFQLDREELYNTIDQLGLDISMHSDPNIGFTSPYKTGQGRGFDITRSYFTKYLREYASFKSEAENREDLSFNLGRINPHISTEEMPALKERMAQDVSLDPFGIPISEYNDNINEVRNKNGQNIFKNSSFMRNFYQIFLKDEVDEPYQLYGLFSQFSEEFREEYWKEARKDALNQLFADATNIDSGENKITNHSSAVDEKFGLIRTALQTDVGIESEWRKIVDNSKAEFDKEIKLKHDNGEESIESLKHLQELRIFSVMNLREIDQGLYQMRNNLEDIVENQLNRINGLSGASIEDENALLNETYKALYRCLNQLWEGNGNEYLISVQGKLSALNNRYDIPQNQILEKAQRIDEDKKDGRLEKGAEAVMAGEEKFFESRNLYEDMLERLMNSFEQALWMDSNILYKIIPAWMSCSNTEVKENGDIVHQGFEAPEFLWEVLVERKHEVEFGEDYSRKLRDNKDFRKDVAAAAGAVYVWSHFTQVRNKFEMRGNQYVDTDVGDYTWVEWMNKYGIGVNFEAMYGSPNTELKIWRSKDIVAAARAINITARKELGEIHSHLYNCPAKFTIDIEHVSSFGADPWHDIEDLIEMEKWIAKNNEWSVPADENNPLAEMVRMYHLTKPGHETRQSASGHIHGPFREGDVQLYTWLHDMVKNGFGKSDEHASIMYEVGGDMTGTVQKAKLSMNMIELGISPEELDPAKVDPGKNYRNEKEALLARFFGMDKPSFNREWAKIEQHAFDPLKGLLEAPEFDYTFSSLGSIKNDNSPQEFMNEEYR